MDKSSLFPIGDVAKLFRLSVSSLRHYEEIGLLLPEYTDPSTGYRYYSTKQFEVLNTIRYLRALDMPLLEIADFLQNRDVDRMEEKLRQQREIVVKKQLQLQRIQCKIDHRLQMLAEAKNAKLNVIELIECPACRIAWMADSLKIHDFLDMEAPIRRLDHAQKEAVVFLGKVGVSISEERLSSGNFSQYDGIFLVLEQEDHFDGETLLLPETLCLRLRFCGGHPEAPQQYQKLMQYIRQHRFRLNGFSREITMIDYGFTSDTQKFVTEIRVPVLPPLL